MLELITICPIKDVKTFLDTKLAVGLFRSRCGHAAVCPTIEKR